MVLKAVIDDSGTDMQGGPYLLAGFCSTVEKWADFSNDWVKELAKPPKIEYLKMAEFYSKKEGQFAGVKKEHRAEKLRSLISIINKYAEFDCSCGVYYPDFQNILEPLLPMKHNKPYSGCSQALMSIFATHYEHLGHKEPINFVFDIQEEHSPKFLFLHEWAKNNLQPLPAFNTLIGKIDHEDDKQFPPLQAADILAWHIRRVASGSNGEAKKGLGMLRSTGRPHFDHVSHPMELEMYASLCRIYYRMLGRSVPQ